MVAAAMLGMQDVTVLSLEELQLIVTVGGCVAGRDGGQPAHPAAGAGEGKR